MIINKGDIQGTVDEFVLKVKLNGEKLDRVTWSVLLRILQKANLAWVQGTCRPTGKGKPSNIWEVKTEALLKLTVDEKERNEQGPSIT